MGSIKTDLLGMKFGRWTVMSAAESRNRRAFWLCKCDCGTEREVIGKDLRNGKSTSCGCISSEKTVKRNLTHGYTTKGISLTYKSWASMKERCVNPNSRVYEYYGGRGITVCERWMDSFENFLSDMGDRPDKNHSIDRIDVNGNYEPSNCKWATVSEQRINTRQRKSKSGIRGVQPTTKGNSWTVTIGSLRVGSYKTLDDAIAARKEAELKYWGKSS